MLTFFLFILYGYLFSKYSKEAKKWSVGTLFIGLIIILLSIIEMKLGNGLNFSSDANSFINDAMQLCSSFTIDKFQINYSMYKYFLFLSAPCGGFYTTYFFGTLSFLIIWAILVGFVVEKMPEKDNYFSKIFLLIFVISGLFLTTVIQRDGLVAVGIILILLHIKSKEKVTLKILALGILILLFTRVHFLIIFIFMYMIITYGGYLFKKLYVPAIGIISFLCLLHFSTNIPMVLVYSAALTFICSYLSNIKYFERQSFDKIFMFKVGIPFLTLGIIFFMIYYSPLHILTIICVALIFTIVYYYVFISKKINTLFIVIVFFMSIFAIFKTIPAPNTSSNLFIITKVLKINSSSAENILSMPINKVDRIYNDGGFEANELMLSFLAKRFPSVFYEPNPFRYFFWMFLDNSKLDLSYVHQALKVFIGLSTGFFLSYFFTTLLISKSVIMSNFNKIYYVMLFLFFIIAMIYSIKVFGLPDRIFVVFMAAFSFVFILKPLPKELIFKKFKIVFIVWLVLALLFFLIKPFEFIWYYYPFLKVW